MINIIQGDILKIQPKENELHYIGHGCNDIGGFGSGVAGQIASKWPNVRSAYNQWYNSDIHFRLGEIDIVPVNQNIAVVNMITQKGIGENRIDGVIIPPIRWDSTYECFMRLRHRINQANTIGYRKRIINLVTIGTGLAGGTYMDFCQTVWKAFNPSVYKEEINIYAYTPEDYRRLQTLVLASEI